MYGHLCVTTFAGGAGGAYCSRGGGGGTQRPGARGGGVGGAAGTSWPAHAGNQGEHPSGRGRKEVRALPISHRLMETWRLSVSVITLKVQEVLQ